MRLLDWRVVAGPLLVLLLGGLWMEKPGLHHDELLFAAPLDEPKQVEGLVTVLGRRYPAMVMPYIGTAKTAFYSSVVFPLFGRSAGSVRWPALGLAALALWIVCRILWGAGRRTEAVLVGLLCGTDVSYLMTARLDWGPVAVQHLMAALTAWAGWRWMQGGQWRWALWCGVFAGVGIWDKLTFAWVVCGLGCGTLATIEWRKFLRVPHVAGFAAGLVLGAYPLVVYNVKTGGGSFAGMERAAGVDVSEKVDVLAGVMSGYTLWGYVVMTPGQTAAREVAGGLASAMDGLARTAGNPSSSYGIWVFLAALATGPWLWRDRLYRFALTAFFVGWAAMIFVHKAGGSSHHVVLLWPLPAVMIAVVLGKLPPAWGRVAAWTAVVFQLLLVNQFYVLLHRHGSGQEWSEGVNALARELEKSEGPVHVLDWGIVGPLRFLGEGKFALHGDGGDLQDAAAARYVTYARGRAFFPEQERRVREMASEQGLELRLERAVPNERGEEAYVIYRLQEIEK